MKIALLLGVVTVGSLAQTPNPCVAPRQWEGTIMRVGEGRDYKVKGSISKDNINERVRVTEEIDYTSEREYYDILELYKEKKSYTVNMRTTQCTISNLTTPFVPTGIPPNSTFKREVVIGAAGIPGENLIVAEFQGKFPDGREFFGSVTEPDCIPVRFGHFSNSSGLIFTNYYDISIGIKDIRVFDTPKQCAQK